MSQFMRMNCLRDDDDGIATSNLERQPDLRDPVRTRLAMGWSPERIAGRLTRAHGRILIRRQSIHRFIHHRSVQKDDWHRLLPRAGHNRGRHAAFGGGFAANMPILRSS